MQMLKNVLFEYCDCSNSLIGIINETEDNKDIIEEILRDFKKTHKILQEINLKLYLLIDLCTKNITYECYIDEDSVEFYDLSYEDSYKYEINFEDLDEDEKIHINEMCERYI